MNPPGRRQSLYLILILLLSAAFRLAVINEPFERDSEGCGAFFGLLARNYFRYDLSTTRGLPVMSMGAGTEPIYYANHPPATVLLIALVNAVTGYRGGYDSLPGDWQVRLPTMLFTLGCAWLIYLLVKNRACPRPGLIGAALFSFIPMTLTFGGLPDVINPQLIFFILLTVAAYERFADQPNFKNLGLLVLAFAGAGIMDWPAFFIVPVLGLHFMLTHKPKQWGWIVGFGAISVAIFAALYVHATLGHPDPKTGRLEWGWMLRQVLHRSSAAGDEAGAFTLAQWLKRAIWELAIARHTLIVAILGAVWMAFAAARKFTGRADRMTGLLLGWMVLHVLIGRQGVFQHEWWWWPLTPGLVIAAALGAEEILSRIKLSGARKEFVVATLLLLFGARNIWGFVQERRSIKPIAEAPLNYSLAEWGQVIRENSAPDSAVMMAEEDKSMALWYYADRAVIRHVWDLETFQRRRTEGWADVTFDYYQRWPGNVSTMIVPKAFISFVKQPLIDHLNQNYPHHETAKFIVWNLSP